MISARIVAPRAWAWAADFDHHDSGALTEHEAVPGSVERPGRPGRVVVPLREGAHVAEGGERHRQERRLRTAGDDHVALVVGDQSQGVLEGDDPRRARRDLRHEGTGQSVLHRDLGGRHAARDGRDREWTDLAGTTVPEGPGALDDLLHPATAGVDHDAHPVALLRRPGREVEAGSIDGLCRSGNAEVDEAAHPASHLAVHRQRRVEVLDLGRDLDVETGGVEGRDQAATRDAGQEIAPVRLGIVADGRDRAHRGHDGAAGRILARHAGHLCERSSAGL